MSANVRPALPEPLELTVENQDKSRIWVAQAVSSTLFSEGLKQKLLEALSDSAQGPMVQPQQADETETKDEISEAFEHAYGILHSEDQETEPPLTGELATTAAKLKAQFEEVSRLYESTKNDIPERRLRSQDASNEGFQTQINANPSVCGTTDNSKVDHALIQANASTLLKTENKGVRQIEAGQTRVVRDQGHTLAGHPEERHRLLERTASTGQENTVKRKSTAQPKNSSRSLGKKPVLLEKNQATVSGGIMADLSGYKDLSKAPLSLGADDELTSPSLDRAPAGFGEREPQQHYDRFNMQSLTQQQSHHGFNDNDQDIDTEFSGNVKTLIRLVNELPSDVTKQTGAQIIRLTMEAMGISMEDVLSEAQSAQSEMLDAVRANIKKIEEYKTVIRKLETDIKYYQGKANELSEIIDLFILSNTATASGMIDSSGY